MSKAHRLGLVLVLNLLLVAALVVVGVTAHSLGVLAAGSIISPTRAASAFR